MIKGSCECGGVRFSFTEAREAVTVCHCSQCRKTSGHLWAATRCDLDDLTFQSDESLTWYASSDFAKRGFCSVCGSSLFYRMNDEDGMAIAAGCLDTVPAEFHIGKHIFAKDKGAYYDINDEVEVLQTY